MHPLMLLLPLFGAYIYYKTIINIFQGAYKPLLSATATASFAFARLGVPALLLLSLSHSVLRVYHAGRERQK